MPIYDFSDIQAAASGEPDPGDYIAKITQVDDITSSGGLPGVKVWFNLERVVGSDAKVNRNWSDRWWLSEKALPYVKANVTTITGSEPTKVDFKRLVGLRTVIVLRMKMDDYYGEERLKVVGYNPLPSSERDPLMAQSSAVAPVSVGPDNADDDSIPF